MGDRYSDLERHALEQRAGAVPQTTTVSPLARAQSQLREHGFDAGAADGTLKPATTQAILSFQQKKGLPQTGTLDSKTKTELAKPPTPGGAARAPMRGGPIQVSRGHLRAGPSKPTAASSPSPSPPVPIAVHTVASASAPNDPVASHLRRGGGLGAPHASTPVRVPGAAMPPSAPRLFANANVPVNRTFASGGRASGSPTLMQTGSPARAPSATTNSRRPNMDQSYENAGRRIPVKFASSGTVGAAGTQDIVVIPQVPFRGENLVVDTTTAANFSIRELKVGTWPQNAGGQGDIPAAQFPPTQAGAVNYEMDLCDAGTQITLTVVNTDGAAAHAFFASIFGHEIKKAA